MYSYNNLCSSRSLLLLKSAATFTASTTTCLGYLSMVVFLPSPHICSWEITLIEEDKESKRFAYFSLIRFCTLTRFSCWGAITSRRQSRKFMDFMKNVKNCLIIGKNRYNIKLWKTFIDCFNCMPVAAIIEDKILCMHGGISPELVSATQVLKIS